MTQVSYRQVLIGEQMVGLFGLDELFSALYAQGREPGSHLAALLLEGVEQRNYIFPKARPLYAAALVREYTRYWRQQRAGGRAAETQTAPSLWRGRPREQVPWFPTLYAERCDGCGDCLRFCAYGVYAADEESGRVVVLEPFRCVVGCDACARVCTRRAIHFPPREMLARLEGVRGRG